MEEKTPLKLISLNTNGLGEVKKRISVLGWLKRNHSAKDKIIFLQETHTSEKTQAKWKLEWKEWEAYFSHGGTGSKGVAIFLPKTMEYKIIEITRSKIGRYLVIRLTIGTKLFVIANCYAPNIHKLKDQLAWLTELQTILQQYENANIIIGGDLNDYFIPQLDKYNCKPRTPESDYVKSWKTICDELNLVDIWRLLNPTRKCYTWRQGSSAANLKQSRLDYWLISSHMIFDLHEVDIKSSIRSDHSLIDLDLYNTDTPKRGPSYWNFNCSLLRDVEYVNKINTCYTNALEKYNDINDKGLKWDLVKMEIRSTTICYSKDKAKANRINLSEAMFRVNELEK
jgi:exonuclease III